MVCFTPMKAAWAAAKSAETGKRGITFNTRKAWREQSLLNLPCGTCMGCRMDRCQSWGIRCSHEAQMHEASCFLTLTYNDDHLPEDNSLRVDVLQEFIRELRRRLRKLGVSIRFLGCGEYGDRTGRAHYHCIIFGYAFPDRVVLYQSRRGHSYYQSPLLDEIWGKGFAQISDVSFESARYVASYSMKTVRGDAADAHYERLHPMTGEVFHVVPEFATMSLKPGIGQSWFERFKSDVFPSDEVLINGRRMKPPRFYEQQLSEPELLALKELRRRKSVAAGHDRTKERMRCRHQLQALNRKYYMSGRGGL